VRVLGGYGGGFSPSDIAASVAAIRRSSGTVAKCPHCRTLILMNQFCYARLPSRVGRYLGDEELAAVTDPQRSLHILFSLNL
jgi:hypothetical protein